MPIDTEALRAASVVYLTQTFWALVAVIVAIVVARAVRAAAVAALQRRRAHQNAVALVGNLSELAILVIGTLAVLAIYTQQSFGWILASFSALGIVLGLSLQDILKNFFAGIYILIERPFRIGDTVTVGEHTGVVQEISFRTTQLRTDDAREVIIPNGVLMTVPVVNLTRYPSRSAHLSISLPADAAGPDTAERITTALAAAPGLVDDPRPTVLLRGYDGGKARYDVTVWGHDRERAAAEAIATVRSLGADWDVRGR